MVASQLVGSTPRQTQGACQGLPESPHPLPPQFVRAIGQGYIEITPNFVGSMGFKWRLRYAARLARTLCYDCEGHIWINLFSITYLLSWLRLLEINECIHNPCKNGGRCYDLYYGFRCKCTAAYKGKTCDQRKYEYEFFKGNFFVKGL